MKCLKPLFVPRQDLEEELVLLIKNFLDGSLGDSIICTRLLGGSATMRLMSRLLYMRACAGDGPSGALGYIASRCLCDTNNGFGWHHRERTECRYHAVAMQAHDMFTEK